ncbi:MAG: uroporphyrinogen decarboxylase family protein [Phycisphaerae bacterium]
MTAKERYLAALAGLPVDHTPLTPIFMAWGANYIQRTYRDYYLDHRVLVEAQLATARRFDLDQVSAISDPWRECSAFGMEFDYPAEGVGMPKNGRHFLESPADVGKLHPYDPMVAPRTRDRIEAVRGFAAVAGSTHSVMGWLDGPMAVYADLRGVQDACLDLLDTPEVFEQAARIITECALAFAAAQVQAGADTIGVGDAAASLLGPDLYARYVLPFEQRLFRGIKEMKGPNVPAGGVKIKLHICGNITRLLPQIALTGADIVDIDWMVSLAEARKILGPQVTLAGNFDPSGVLLQSTPELIAAAARDCIRAATPPVGTRFVLQPGCEVPPGTPESNIDAFCRVAAGWTSTTTAP